MGGSEKFYGILALVAVAGAERAIGPKTERHRAGHDNQSATSEYVQNRRLVVIIRTRHYLPVTAEAEGGSYALELFAHGAPEQPLDQVVLIAEPHRLRLESLTGGTTFSGAEFLVLCMQFLHLAVHNPPNEEKRPKIFRQLTENNFPLTHFGFNCRSILVLNFRLEILEPFRHLKHCFPFFASTSIDANRTPFQKFSLT
jgi:hypothetical protein